MSKRNYSLIATKRPRDIPLTDEPIKFQPLTNLHLELLENKNKIKQGSPDIISPKKPIPPPKKEEIITPKDQKPVEKPVKKDTPVPPKKEEEKKEDQKTTKENTTPPKKEEPKVKIIPPKIIPKKKDIVEEFSLEEIIDEEDEHLKDIQTDEEIETDEGEELTIEENIDEENIDEEEDVDEVEEEDDEKKEVKKEEKKEEEIDIYAGLSPIEREKKEKEEYMWKFTTLRKKYKNPSVEIPLFNEHSELSDMKSAYERTLRELYLDRSVDSYRSYLFGGFMVTEFVCTNFLNIDLGGFTSTQSQAMYKYDILLIELGEKSYTNWSSKIPVELRLAGLILLQAGLFYLGKVISSNYGGGMADIFRGIMGQPSVPSETSSEPVKKKMRGPKFKADDIRNMNHAKKE
jgi:hypothetical protein